MLTQGQRDGGEGAEDWFLNVYTWKIFFIVADCLSHNPPEKFLRNCLEQSGAALVL